MNVALTRARSEMLVFCSLPAERIDLSRTQAQAVTDLKHFLEYAEKGPSALGAAVYGSQGDFESPFEIAVSRALRERGWTIRPQIGVSAYRIDLGVVHPDKPGVYLAGVECDGATYHSSATARDRDKVRQGVLENLGWKLVRIWSTDWWVNKPKSTENLHNQLKQILEIERKASASTAGETNFFLSSNETLVDEPRSFDLCEPTMSAEDASEPSAVLAWPQTLDPRRTQGDGEEQPVREPVRHLMSQESQNRHRYIYTTFDDESFIADATQFYDEGY